MKVVAGGIAAVAAAGVASLALAVFGGDDGDTAAAAPASGGTGVLNAAAIPQAYRDIVASAGKRCAGVSGPVLAAQVEAESGWNPKAQSPAGAQGIAQFMPGTWTSWGKDYDGDGAADVLNGVDAIGSQADYMCSLRSWVDEQLKADKIQGDPLQLTLASYNAGTGNVAKASGVPEITETQQYITRILAAIPRYTSTLGDALVGIAVDAGGGPPVSKDGTFREAIDGSGHLDTSNLCRIPWAGADMFLRCDAEHAFAKLDKEFHKKFGHDLTLNAAYRDYATQVYLYATMPPGVAAKPGTSNHGWGLAVDLGNVGTEGSATYDWMLQNAPAYGWSKPSWAKIGGSGAHEPWHWEFVGTKK
ncbi:transglycosylase SLT domain-containing protein [Luteimicrobium sp. DT211]|uniref:transglycosylase SLT domain-containing protein n=1 Tax=Luteimicrobium sp. DT211 TaxID=3393412 RepID=UPI003CEFAE2F